MDSNLVAVITAAIAAAILASLGPAWLARIPEPEDAELGKRTYVELASTRRLALWFAVVAAVVAGTVALAIENNAILPLWVFLAAVGVMLGFVDWHTRRLPTSIVAPTYGAVFLLLAIAGLVSGDWSRAGQALLAGLVVFALYFLGWLIFPRGMGYGDVRLSGVLGIALGWLGWSEVFAGIYAGFVFGAILGFVLSRMRIVDAKGFPFCPFMLLGAWFGAVAGPAVAGLIG